ncbi:hypothetical protein SDC9_168886 [bioreactor metagenome]|uniref:Uncharacterized protein n=1 Tax=bioreactor metagenome TaxID=1076179 RepID=A0A645G5V0_9ZZZZ
MIGRGREADGIVVHHLKRAERGRGVHRERIVHRCRVAHGQVDRKRFIVLIAGNVLIMRIQRAREFHANMHGRICRAVVARCGFAVDDSVYKRICAVALR